MRPPRPVWAPAPLPSDREPLAPPYRALAFEPGGRGLVAGADDGWVALWDLPSGQPLARSRAHAGAVRAVAFSPDGLALATAGGDWIKRIGEFALWDTHTRGKAPLWAAAQPVCAAAFSPDGAGLLAASGEGRARLWGLPRRDVRALPSPHRDEVLSAAFSPAGDRFALACADGAVSLWRARPAELVAVLAGHASAVWGVAFSPDGGLLASAGADGTIALWGAREGELRRTIRAHRHPVRAVLFCPRTALLISGEGPPQGEASLKAWDVASGEGWQFALHSTAVLALALSPDGRALATAGRDGAVRLWSWGQAQVRAVARQLPACARPPQRGPENGERGWCGLSV